MTCDMTYHPISEVEMKRYALFLDDVTSAAEACDTAGLDGAHKEHFLGLLPRFRDPSGGPFDLNHGYHIALTQGFFGTYFYTRGSMMSAVGPAIEAYTKPWSDALPEMEATASASNQVVGEYSSGVYLPPEGVIQLMQDYERNSDLANAVQAQFPSVNLNILWAALTHASSQSLGLLEARGAIEPNPLDLQTSRAFTTFANCDPTGLNFYAHAAQAAAEARAASQPPPPATASQPPPPQASPPPPAATAPPPPSSVPAVATQPGPAGSTTLDDRPSSGLAARLQELRDQQHAEGSDADPSVD